MAVFGLPLGAEPVEDEHTLWRSALLVRGVQGRSWGKPTFLLAWASAASNLAVVLEPLEDMPVDLNSDVIVPRGAGAAREWKMKSVERVA